MAIAQVVQYHGSPAIMIDGKIYPPMMVTIRTNNRTGMVIDENYYRALSDSGIKIFFVICDTEWLKKGAFDQFREEAETILRVAPDAYIMVRIGLHPPLEWCENNPDEMMQYSDGLQKTSHLYTESFEQVYPAMYSLCSEKWRRDAGKALLDTCRAIEKLPYADRIAGYFFAAGGTSEWYYITPTEFTPKTDYLDTGGFEQTADRDYENVYADLSPAFRKQFTRYLTNKYGTDEALQNAWANPAATLKNAPIPDCAKRYYIDGVDYDLCHPQRLNSNSAGVPAPENGTNIGHFIDVQHHQDVYDFFRAWHQGTAESVIYFGNLIKAHDPQKLTGAFYGSAGSCKFFAFGQIGSVTDILHSGAIDFLASPGVYENRQPGGFTGQRQCFDSFRLQNRIFVVEEDARTHFENRYFQNYVEMYDMDDTFHVLKREFGRNIAYDVQAWWFDQLLGGRRYREPAIYALFQKQQQLAQEAYSLDRKKNSEIAFIYDEDSYHLISQESNHQMVELFNNYEIDKIGAPADRYFKRDLMDEKMPDYKMYVLMNTLCFNDRERIALHHKLKKNHATALFLYASGVVDFEAETKWDVRHMEVLTGIRMGMDPGVYRGKFKINGTPHAITARLDRGEIYGDFKRKMWANASSFMSRIKTSEVNLYPLIYADDPQALVLSYFLDSKKPALVLKEQKDFNALYCGSKYVGFDVIREIARYAGCHIYIETEDVLYANAHYVTIHASSTGEKLIRLPGRYSVEEVYEETSYGENCDEISFSMLKGDTKMFRLRQAK